MILISSLSLGLYYIHTNAILHTPKGIYILSGDSEDIEVAIWEGRQTNQAEISDTKINTDKSHTDISKDVCSNF